MNNEVKNTLTEIRTKQKKMTRTAIARIIDKKNDPAFSTILVDNKLNNSYSNINWANYVFEVDGKDYSGYDIVHPLHGKTCKILYNPEAPSQNRTKYARTMEILRSPVFTLLFR